MPHDQSTVKPHAKLERLPPGNSFAWSLTFSRKKPPEFRALIDDLKSAVESWDRRYLPETYVWQIADGYVDALKVVMGRYGVELTVVGDVPSPGREQALRELFLTADAPSFLIEAAYKTLAKRYHPDAGGDLAKMQRLNQIVELLR